MPNQLTWLLVAAASLLIAWLVTARLQRQRARPTPGKAPGKAPAQTRRPQPREIWWADVPFHGEPGSKVRPCLVIRTTRGGADVLKITSQDQSDRADHVVIRTQAWDRGADHDSYLDLSDPYEVADAAFERKVGMVDDATWRVVQRRHP